MQFAHPMIAAGVMEHSAFRDGRFTAAARLHHTVRSMLALGFGTDAERNQTLELIKGIHRRVNGTLRDDVGPYVAGTHYSAEDPALLLWVHGTLLESVPLVYERLVSPLSAAERDQYCLDAEPIARELGAHPAAIPRSWSAMQQYLQDTYASGAIAVGPDARGLAEAVLHSPFLRVVPPLAALNRAMTIGLLPDRLRQAYGFTWTERDERALAAWSGRLRRLRRVLPDRLALWPEARRAERTGG